jgi:hypothetical protein
LLKDQGKTSKNEKFPLLWMVMDFVEKKGAADKDFYCELNDLQFILGMQTDAVYSMDERRR